MAPREVVIDEEPGGASALNPSIVETSNRSERCIRSAALQHYWESGESLLKIARPEQAFVPRERRVEVVHHSLRKHMRVTRRERIERLWRHSIRAEERRAVE